MLHGTPCLARFNDRRQKLMKTMMMLVDESGSGWRPKTTKLRGLPNYMFEPRKPVPLGTMFRNGVECVSGILVVHDVVRNPEQQSLKSYFGGPSTLPNSADIGAHTAEVCEHTCPERSKIQARAKDPSEYLAEMQTNGSGGRDAAQIPA